MELYLIILISLGSLLGLIILVIVLLYLICSLINPTKGDPELIDNKTGFFKAYKTSLYDGNGKKIILKGVNLGNWFVQEPWMTVSAINGSFNNMFGYTQRKAIEAFKNNPNLDNKQIEELKNLYLDTFIKEDDFKTIKELGFNVIRINFTCYNLTIDGYQINEEAFNKLDWAIDMASKYDLYVILDNHGAIGSQNSDNHSGDDNHYELYGNEKNERATIELWKYIATRYKDNKTIIIYDLLNEPRKAVNKFCGKKQFDFYDSLYKEIRNIDSNHILMMECFTFPNHGVNPNKYNWDNIIYSYHIYNLTIFSEKFAINFYRVMHNLLRYKVPIVIGEFSCWDNKKEWYHAFNSFNKLGWSYLVWTYKANKYFYINKENKIFPFKMWGLFESNIKPIDIDKATYEQIKETYLKIETKYCEKTLIYEIYESVKEK